MHALGHQNLQNFDKTYSLPLATVYIAVIRFEQIAYNDLATGSSNTQLTDSCCCGVYLDICTNADYGNFSGV